AVTHPEVSDVIVGMQIAAVNRRDRDVDIAAQQAREQGEKRQLRRQTQRAERIMDDGEFEQHEDKTEQQQEQERIQDEERREEHGAILARRSTLADDA